MNVQNSIWDCDGVMWDHLPQEPIKIAEALKIKNVKQFELEFYNMIKFFNIYFCNKKVTLLEFYKVIEKEMPILYFYSITPKQFMEILQVLKFETIEFNEDVLVVMEYLQEKGVKNIIKTDWWRNYQQERLKHWGVLNYIERLYCCDNSYLKCNPLSAKEIINEGHEAKFVIIGDSLTSDIAFAKHSGIKSIWLNKDNKQENNSPYKPDFEVASLLEVMEII